MNKHLNQLSAKAAGPERVCQPNRRHPDAAGDRHGGGPCVQNGTPDMGACEGVVLPPGTLLMVR